MEENRCSVSGMIFLKSLIYSRNVMRSIPVMKDYCIVIEVNGEVVVCKKMSVCSCLWAFPMLTFNQNQKTQIASSLG